MAKYETVDFAKEENLLVITSTYGDGEPPDNGQAFWNFIKSAAAPSLAHTSAIQCCRLGTRIIRRSASLEKSLRRAVREAGSEKEFILASIAMWITKRRRKVMDGRCFQLAGCGLRSSGAGFRWRRGGSGDAGGNRLLKRRTRSRRDWLPIANSTEKAPARKCDTTRFRSPGRDWFTRRGTLLGWCRQIAVNSLAICWRRWDAMARKP